jgi:hypothetical protein
MEHGGMKYFIDTEYQWNDDATLYPLSIAIVAEDGREFYCVLHPIFRDDWSPFLIEHVLPVLRAGVETTAYIREAARDAIKAFIGDDHPEFWGDYAAFDYVMLSWVMGSFEDWPEGWPMHINDFQQAGIEGGSAEIPHNALSDARAMRDAFLVTA